MTASETALPWTIPLYILLQTRFPTVNSKAIKNMFVRKTKASPAATQAVRPHFLGTTKAQAQDIPPVIRDMLGFPSDHSDRTGDTGTGLYADFSQIPLHSPARGLQSKLTVSKPADRFEQEADSVAGRAMESPAPAFSAAQRGINGEPTQPKTTEGAGISNAPPVVDRGLRAPGTPLDASTRAFMEPRFGHNFSQVRIHTSNAAELSARRLGARAYTLGQHLVFDAGQFAPGTSAGRSLIAHELTHVVQQASAGNAGGQTQSILGVKVSGGGQNTIQRSLSTYNQAINRKPEPDWQLAAEHLNGESPDVIERALRSLTPFQRAKLHHAALVWPGRNSNVAQLTVQDHLKFFPTVTPEADETDPEAAPDARKAVARVDLEGRKKTREEVQAVNAPQIRAQWGTNKGKFVAVAGDPSNQLTALQLYQIWIHGWMDEQAVAIAEEARIRKAIQSADPVAYLDKKWLFDKGKRGVLGPEYQAASERLTTVNFLTSGTFGPVHDWLEIWVDGTGHHVTLNEINQKALEIAKTRAWFDEYMVPLILFGLGAVGPPKVSAPASASGAVDAEAATKGSVLYSRGWQG